jgi:hypothetical protein
LQKYAYKYDLHNCLAALGVQLSYYFLTEGTKANQASIRWLQGHASCVPGQTDQKARLKTEPLEQRLAMLQHDIGRLAHCRQEE